MCKNKYILQKCVKILHYILKAVTVYLLVEPGAEAGGDWISCKNSEVKMASAYSSTTSWNSAAMSVRASDRNSSARLRDNKEKRIFNTFFFNVQDADSLSCFWKWNTNTETQLESERNMFGFTTKEIWTEKYRIQLMSQLLLEIVEAWKSIPLSISTDSTRSTLLVLSLQHLKNTTVFNEGSCTTPGSSTCHLPPGLQQHSPGWDTCLCNQTFTAHPDAAACLGVQPIDIWWRYSPLLVLAPHLCTDQVQDSGTRQQCDYYQ